MSRFDRANPDDSRSPRSATSSAVGPTASVAARVDAPVRGDSTRRDDRRSRSYGASTLATTSPSPPGHFARASYERLYINDHSAEPFARVRDGGNYGWLLQPQPGPGRDRSAAIPDDMGNLIIIIIIPDDGFGVIYRLSPDKR